MAEAPQPNLGGPRPRWLLELLEDGWEKRCHFDGNGILTCKVARTPALELYERLGGTRLRQLQYEPYTLAYWETKIYKDHIASLLEESGFNPRVRSRSIAVDLGSGDGRFTEYLVSLGFGKVIAVDNNYASLRSLAEYVDREGLWHRVALVRSDIVDVPLRSSSVDFVLAVEALYYLNQSYEKGLMKVRSILRTGGYLLESEPDTEGMAVKTLVFESFEGFLETLETGYFPETYHGVSTRFRSFTLDELLDVHRRLGFRVLGVRGLPLYPLLVRILQLRGAVGEDKLRTYEERLREVFRKTALAGRCRRVNIVLSRKEAELQSQDTS